MKLQKTSIILASVALFDLGTVVVAHGAEKLSATKFPINVSKTYTAADCTKDGGEVAKVDGKDVCKAKSTAPASTATTPPTPAPAPAATPAPKP